MKPIAAYPKIGSAQELISLVEEVGMLPFFNSGIEGFCLEALTDPGHWFVDDVDGPWEWKGTFLQTGMAYGKLFKKKAVFMTREWYGILACYRRDGYDFEGMYEDGFVPHGGKYIVEALEGGSMVSTELRRITGFTPNNDDAPIGKDFDSIVTTLQMQTFISTSAFEQPVDRHGRPFGWGLARYALSDLRFRDEITRAEERYSPQEAKTLIEEHVARLCPSASVKQIERFTR